MLTVFNKLQHLGAFAFFLLYMHAGSLTATPLSACGEPVINAGVDREVFVWKDCASGVWHTRFTPGGVFTTYRGAVDSSVAFSSVVPVGIESGDMLDYVTDATRIDYILNISNGYFDGIDFTYPAGARVCFGLDQPAGQAVLVGADRTPVSAPFDLDTLGPCGGAVLPVISINDVSVVETGGTVDFTLNLSPASTETVTVDVATADGTATAGDDYSAVPLRTVTFDPGETSQPVTVTILDDGLPEGNETFVLQLSAPVGAVLPSVQATATIQDDEVSPCGEPEPGYDAATEAGVFIWKDCAAGGWHVRMTAGGGYSVYEGEVVANQAFSSVTPISLESNDTVNFTADPTRISYSLHMGAQWEDGFDFSYPAGASVCFGFDFTYPAGAAIYVGAARTPVSAPYNLETLGPC